MEKLWTLPEVLEFVGVSYQTLVRWRNAGLFPESLNGKGRKLLWSESQITEWVNRRLSPVTPVAINLIKQKKQTKDKALRLKIARESLERHRKQK